MVSKIIDLSKKNGVTIHLTFKNIVAPFLVAITDVSGQVIFYYRIFDKENLRLNLPKHPEKILLRVDAPVEISNFIVTDLNKQKIKYNFNKEILVKRPYPIESVQFRTVPYLLDNKGNINRSPARFLPSIGMIEFNQSITRNLPQPVNAFIGMHELGHYYYGRPIPIQFHKSQRAFYENQLKEDEQEADRFALYNFINEGYNFSGALQSLTDHLSSNYITKQRISTMGEEIKKMHKYIEY